VDLELRSQGVTESVTASLAALPNALGNGATRFSRSSRTRQPRRGRSARRRVPWAARLGWDNGQAQFALRLSFESLLARTVGRLPARATGRLRPREGLGPGTASGVRFGPGKELPPRNLHLTSWSWT
jgi:hypothetical protein